MIKIILKTAIKYLWKNRLYNAINIFGLTVAITSILIIFLYIANEYKFDSNIRNKDHIYRLEATWAQMPSFPGHILKSETGFIETMTRIKIEDHDVMCDNLAYRIENVGLADSTFFDVFNFKFLLGNAKSALRTIHSIVLTQSQSYKIFGKANPLNKVILLDNIHPFTITGIIQDPEYFHLPFTCIATLESLKEYGYKEILEQKDGWDYFTYLVTKPGQSKKETEKKVLQTLDVSGYKKSDAFHLSSLADLYFSAPLNYEGITLHGNKSVLFILFSIAILLLILACINFINLTNARSHIREKEVGIKKLTGFTRTSLLMQFMFESVIIIFFSLFFALILIDIIQPLFWNLIDKRIDFTLLYVPRNILIVFSATLFIGLLTGLYPALFMSATKPISLLKNKQMTSSSNSLLSKGLITFQYTISILLIIGTFTIIKQIHALKIKDLGFEKDHLIYIRTNESIIKQQNSFKEELLKIPGIKKVAYSGATMGHEWSNWVNDINGEGRAFKVTSVDPDYFDLMGITLKEGRTFVQQDQNSCYVINETAVKKYNLKEPLEKVMKREGKLYPIVGVVKDFHFQSPQYPIEPVLFNFRSNKYKFITLKISVNNTKEITKKIEDTWKKFSPTYVFEYHFMDELYDRQYKSDEQLGSLVGIGGCIAIIIACLGILGMVISTTKKRIKEIGIRRVNGARVIEILAMLNQDFVKWVAIAFIIACPIAWYAMHKWLQSFAYKTELSWWVFGVAGIVAMAVAILTVSWQSWRAATRNPAEALRYE